MSVVVLQYVTLHLMMWIYTSIIKHMKNGFEFLWVAVNIKRYLVQRSIVTSTDQEFSWKLEHVDGLRHLKVVDYVNGLERKPSTEQKLSVVPKSSTKNCKKGFVEAN